MLPTFFQDVSGVFKPNDAVGGCNIFDRDMLNSLKLDVAV